MERRRERFAEKRDTGLDQPTAGTPRNGTAGHVVMHFGVRVWGFAVDAVLGGEGAVSFDHFFGRNTGSAFKGVNVLREAF